MASRKAFLSVIAAASAACGSGGGTDGDAGIDGPEGMRPPILSKGVSTLAGWSEAGYLDGNRQVNLFNNPVNVHWLAGRLYVADFDNSKLRDLDLEGTASTVVSSLGFLRPFGIAHVDGTLYVSTDNDCNGQHDPAESGGQMTGAIWRVDIAGRTATCLADQLGRPRGLAGLADGRLAVADYAHHDIRIFDPSARTMTPLAGTRDTSGATDGVGAAAQFNVPYGLVQRADGKLVVLDWGNHRVRLVALDGSVTTLGGSDAGFADGAMQSARFNHPLAIAKAQNGELFITDTDNYRIRKISADGTNVTTIAGSGAPGAKDSENPLEAELYGLEGLDVMPDGKTIFFADGSRGEADPYNRIRIIKL